MAANFDEPTSMAELCARFSVALGSAATFVFAFCILRFGGLAAALFGTRYRSLSAVDQTRWNEKLLSIVHALVATQGALRSIAQTFAELDAGTREYHHMIVMRGVVPHRDFYIQLSIGYFLSDLVVYLLPPRHHTLAEFVHHLTATASYGVGVYYQWASFVQINFLQNEMSTPFYQATWFLRVCGLRLSAADVGSRALFALLFFCSRIVWNCVICWHVVLALRVEPIPVPMWAFPFQLVTLVLHVGLQFFWFRAIVAIFVGTVGEFRGTKSGPSHAELELVRKAEDDAAAASADVHANASAVKVRERRRD